MVNTSDLVTLGSTASGFYREYDDALTQLEDSFGLPFKAAKDNLIREVRLADKEGVNLDCFVGSDSRFRFPEHDAKIIVRFIKKPTEHTQLTKLADKVAKLEQDLKIAKLKLKNATEELVASGACDEITARIDLAFSRL